MRVQIEVLGHEKIHSKYSFMFLIFIEYSNERT